MKQPRASINISLEAKSRLDSIKSSGQSYDGLIRDLIEFWQEESGQYWVKRRQQRNKPKDK